MTRRIAGQCPQWPACGPEFGRLVVVVSDHACAIAGVDGSGIRIEQGLIATVALLLLLTPSQGIRGHAGFATGRQEW